MSSSSPKADTVDAIVEDIRDLAAKLSPGVEGSILFVVAGYIAQKKEKYANT